MRNFEFTQDLDIQKMGHKIKENDGEDDATGGFFFRAQPNEKCLHSDREILRMDRIQEMKTIWTTCEDPNGPGRSMVKEKRLSGCGRSGSGLRPPTRGKSETPTEHGI